MIYFPRLKNLHKIVEILLNKYYLEFSVNWKSLVPFLPLILMAILIILKPYYLFPTPGDIDFHLMRAREIIANPSYGILYHYMINYPLGRPVIHPPLFHSVMAALWYLGGVRFAHSVLCVFQILLSIGVATWFANKKYGMIAGFFAGLLVFSSPLPDTLFVPIPATYIPILGVLTIYFMPKSGKKALITSLIGIWTHLIGNAIFPLLFISNEKGREYLKNWKISLLLFSSVIFWVAYWLYFTGQPGNPVPKPSVDFIRNSIYMLGSVTLLIFGTLGFTSLFKEDKEEFKLFSAYFLSIILFSAVIGDLTRGLQYAALPLAILSGLFVQRTYEYFSNQGIALKNIFLLLMLFFALLSSFNLVDDKLIWDADWKKAEIPFENEYYGLKIYVDAHTDEKEVVGVDKNIAFKVAWMTGRNVFNEEFGTVQGLNSRHDLNVYEYPDHFTIADENNITQTEIPLESEFIPV